MSLKNTIILNAIFLKERKKTLIQKKKTEGPPPQFWVRPEQRQRDSYRVSRGQSSAEQAWVGTTPQPTKLRVPIPKLHTRKTNFPNMVCSLPPGITRPTLPQ